MPSNWSQELLIQQSFFITAKTATCFKKFLLTVICWKKIRILDQLSDSNNTPSSPPVVLGPSSLAVDGNKLFTVMANLQP